MNGSNGILFPDTNYKYVSGGDPEEIPNLTYEQFLETHRKFYRLDNSYIILYGKMDIEEKLKFLDEQYLSHGERSCNKIEFKWQNPIIDMDGYRVHHTDGEEKEQCQISLSYVVGSYKDREQIMALKVLMEVLMGSNESLLRKNYWMLS